MRPVIEPLRQQIKAIIWGTHPRFGHLFDYVMIVLIVISVVSLTIASIEAISDEMRTFLMVLETSILIIFTAEYIARIWTSDKRLNYLFSFWGIVDLIAILPYWLATAGLLGAGDGSQTARMLRIMRVLRLLKLARYVAAVDRLRRALELISTELILFISLALITILIVAVGIHSFEGTAQPEHFGSIPQCLWFAVVTLTTVGYGDVYPITVGGKIFTGMILFVGIGIVAIPTGLIASGLAQARDEEEANKKKE